MTTDGQSDDLAEVRDELRVVARDLLGKVRPPAQADWGVLASSGWLGLEVPGALDGADATFAEVAVICEEMGRATTCSPYLGAVVLGVGTLLALEPSPRRDELLRQTATGAVIPVAVLADGSADGPLGPPPGEHPPGEHPPGERPPAEQEHGGAPPTVPFRLDRTPDGLRLHGRADFVPDAAAAGRLLLLARAPGEGGAPGGDGVPVVVDLDPRAPGLSAAAQPVLDETRRLAVLSAYGVEVPDGSVLRFAGDPRVAVGQLLDRAAVAVACDSLGLAEAMLDATVAYARVREQFGRPIGSFQAVQHSCADMLVRVRVARELVAAAARVLASGGQDAGVAASMAKSYACGAAVDVAGKAMQLHGGIGYTWESGVHVYLKRAALNRSLFGSPMAHRKRLAARYR